MKNNLLTALLLIFYASSSIAQQDVKLNVFGALLKNYGVGYEYALNSKISVGAFINYADGNVFRDFMNDINNDNITNYNFSLSPEIKYYINPDMGSDKLFVSLYLRYQNTIWQNLRYNSSTRQETTYNLNIKQFGFGITIGKKWINQSGIYLETLIGFGGFVYTNTSYSDYEVEHFYKNNYFNNEYINLFEARLQIALGYRFDSY